MRSMKISETFRHRINILGLSLGWISGCNNLMRDMLGHWGQFLYNLGTFGEFHHFANLAYLFVFWTPSSVWNLGMVSRRSPSVCENFVTILVSYAYYYTFMCNLAWNWGQSLGFLLWILKKICRVWSLLMLLLNLSREFQWESGQFVCWWVKSAPPCLI